MNVARLKKLAEILRGLKLKENELEFDMGGWVSREFYPEVSREKTELVIQNGQCKTVKTKEVVEEGFCKTAACILGHASLAPEFNKLGLKVTFSSEQMTEKLTEHGYLRAKISYRGQTDFEAGASFFDLSQDEAEELFYGDFSTPKQGAAFIDRMISRHEKEKRNGS